MDRKQFREVMVLLFSSYGKQPDPMVADSYYNFLKHLDLDTFKQAIDNLIRTCQFFPSVSQILDEVVNDGIDESMIRADIIKAIRDCGSYKTPTFNHDISKAIVNDLGWGNICRMNMEDLNNQIHYRFVPTHKNWLESRKNGVEFLPSPYKALLSTKRGGGFKKLGDITNE